MKRGDIVIAAIAGDYGKPRPYVVVQTNALAEMDSVILCPTTSDVRGASAIRVPLRTDAETGLRAPSEIMVEKLQTVRRNRISQVIGRLDDEAISLLDARLAFVLGLRG